MGPGLTGARFLNGKLDALRAADGFIDLVGARVNDHRPQGREKWTGEPQVKQARLSGDRESDRLVDQHTAGTFELLMAYE
jgi:hypothetical protein